ncbi:hypothetical protein [Lactococcus kimchii]|uniref:hypothetical protein n=1 Tax=Lactococcus sp. S-13 TaxID=2507158 RepID=UPI0010231C3F|nr:hypothetical protein [Lactococcus sp. S-13]RZI48706.1 hypothetical protein EQJ87_04145 [Lactococcus sp. S-13]
MSFEFEGFIIQKAGCEKRLMQTAKKVNNVSTQVTIFHAKRADLALDFLYCQGANGDTWIVAENVESLSPHVHRAEKTRMSVDKFEEKHYCRLWQEVKKNEDWSQTKKSLPLSELGKYSTLPLRTRFADFGATVGTLEQLLKSTKRDRGQFGLLFPAGEQQVPICAYLLTRVLPLL